MDTLTTVRSYRVASCSIRCAYPLPCHASHPLAVEVLLRHVVRAAHALRHGALPAAFQSGLSPRPLPFGSLLLGCQLLPRTHECR